MNEALVKTPSKTHLFLYFFIYAMLVAGYLFFTYSDQKHSALQETDEKLLVAAQSLKYMMAQDFHDRAVDEKNVSTEEELENRRRLSTFAEETPFVHLYTLVEKNGSFRFSTPSATGKEAREHASRHVYSCENVPESFRKALLENTIVYETHTDQWGTFRSVAVPEHSPGGNVYLACADLDISFLNAGITRQMFRAIVSGLAFLLLPVPFLLILRNQDSTIKRVNAAMARYQRHLEELVATRTAELAKETETLREQASRDCLTGLYNRKFVMDTLTEQLTRSKMTGVPLCAMMIDVDGFKSMNDIRGHLFGDSVLRRICEILRDDTRAVDVVGRFGGDEFVVLLPGMSINKAVIVAERLCRRVREQHIEEGGHVLTLSIGIAERCPWETSTEDRKSVV